MCEVAIHLILEMKNEMQPILKVQRKLETFCRTKYIQLATFGRIINESPRVHLGLARWLVQVQVTKSRLLFSQL